MEKKDIFGFKPIEVPDDLDFLYKCVYLYSCYKVMAGKVNKPLPPRQNMLLALYILHGVEDETKKMAVEYFDSNDKHINSLNYHLRENGYLEKHRFHERKSVLCSSLQQLKDYFEKDPKTVANFLLRFNLSYGDKGEG